MQKLTIDELGIVVALVIAGILFRAAARRCWSAPVRGRGGARHRAVDPGSPAAPNPALAAADSVATDHARQARLTR